MLLTKKNLSLLLSLLFFTSLLFSELSPEQLKMIEQLPPDQRAGILEKMETASALQDEVEQAFDDNPSLVKKPELRDFKEEDDYCPDCIYGFNFFQFSPSSFSPVNDTPVDSSYILGPGDKLVVDFYGANVENIESTVNREGKIILPFIGPVNFLGMTFEQASKYLETKVQTELIGTEVSLSIKEVRSIGIYLLG